MTNAIIPTPPDRPSLTSPQRRSLSVAVQQALEACERVEQLVLREEATLLWCHPLNSGTRSAALLEVGELRAALLALVTDASLSLAPKDIHSRIRSEVTALWSGIEDLLPQRLVGFGQVTPITVSWLQQRVAPLTQSTQALIAMVSVDTEEMATAHDLP